LPPKLRTKCTAYLCGVEKCDAELWRQLVLRKIGPQFPQSPEGRLMLAVVGQAIRDLHGRGRGCELRARRQRESAARYLGGEMPHAEACGVSSHWVRKIMRDVELGLVDRAA